MKQGDLGEYEENIREKQNVQYTRQKHQLLKPRHMDYIDLWRSGSSRLIAHTMLLKL
jgi:hypothetical protein